MTDNSDPLSRQAFVKDICEKRCILYVISVLKVDLV